MGQTNSGFISIVGSVSVSVAIPTSGIVLTRFNYFFSDYLTLIGVDRRRLNWLHCWRCRRILCAWFAGEDRREGRPDSRHECVPASWRSCHLSEWKSADIEWICRRRFRPCSSHKSDDGRFGRCRVSNDVWCRSVRSSSSSNDRRNCKSEFLDIFFFLA